MKDLNNNIKLLDLSTVIEDRYSKYAKYIIQERALPDARDGLKPVQRRILFSMLSLGLLYEKTHKKSARIVGEVIGKYHPHGDNSVYEAMIRMSQNWKTNLPLVDIQGNNGSIDGDSAAAMRYTETKLSKVGTLMTENLNIHTSPFVANFDDSEIEPIIFPSSFPNLLVNGATGIAAGYATNIPPHNLHEIIKMLIYRIDHPNSPIEKLISNISGPDFPTGGIVENKEGIINAYKTGIGKIFISSKIEINNTDLIITEIPYETNKKTIIQKIDTLRMANSSLSSIKSVIDQSDKNGLRIVVETNSDNLEFIRKFLLNKTNLRISYNYNLIAIIDNKPMKCNIANLADAYIKHQFQFIVKKINYELQLKRKRQNIILGFIKAFTILEQVLNLIKNSKNKSDAENNLINIFQFNATQAEAIVSLRLYNLTSKDIVEFENEKRILNKEIFELNKIVKSNNLINQQIKKKLTLIDSSFNHKRRTVIKNQIENIDISDQYFISEHDVFLVVTAKGYIKQQVYSSRINKYSMIRKPHDSIVARYISKNSNDLIICTNKGNIFKIPLSLVTISKSNTAGIHLSSLIKIQNDEKIIFTYIYQNVENEDLFLFISTKYGYGKKILLNNIFKKKFEKPISIIKLKEKDEVVSIFVIENNDEFLINITKNGFITKYFNKNWSASSLKSFGNKLIKLKSNDLLIKTFSSNATKNNECVMVNNLNKYKKICIDDIKILGRPAVGIKIAKLDGWIVKTITNNAKNHLIYFKKDNTVEIMNVNKLELSKINNKFKSFDINNIQNINFEIFSL